MTKEASENNNARKTENEIQGESRTGCARHTPTSTDILDPTTTTKYTWEGTEKHHDTETHTLDQETERGGARKYHNPTPPNF